MPDPTSSNILLAEPTRGSDSGTWDVPVNGNMTALDGILGGYTTIALSSATSVLLSVPATGTVAASAGPNQSQNAVIKLTGTLSGSSFIKLTLPRLYVFDNQCTMGASFIQVAPSTGTGTAIGLPPGQKVAVSYDGANVDFVGLPLVGSYLDLPVTGVPTWMQVCTQAPYLVCDGTVYSISVFPALGNMLGASFGGNGINTFAVPDARGRVRAILNQATGRLTAAGSGVNGDVLGGAGGNEFMQAHAHANVLNDPGHVHSYGGITPGGPNVGSGSGFGLSTNVTANAATGMSITNAAAGAGTSQNVQPTYISGITFIKT